MPDYTPDGRIGNLIVRGRALQANIAEAVTGGTVSLSRGEVTQLELSIDDPDYTLLRSRLFDLGGQCDYADLLLVVAAVGAGSNGDVEAIDVTARSLHAQWMRQARGELVERGTSPTAYMARRCAESALKFVGEPSAARNTVARGTGDQAENDWDTGQRLARELGFIAFEAAGVYYFGRPTWLLEELPRIALTPATDGVVGRPKCRRTTDDPAGFATVDLDVTDDLAGKLRPGMRLDFAGVPTFEGAYLIDAVTIPLDDTVPATVKASTPVNPTAEGEDKAEGGAAGETGGSSSGRSSGGPTAAAFVDVALRQAGDRYVYGAEASASNADPTAFDCSELVEWALARVGVRFVDGSANQLARCRAKGTTVSVAEGIRTRGALLFHPGHVAISLGNGRTIEAANRKYGVRELSAAGRFTSAARVPGLTY